MWPFVKCYISTHGLDFDQNTSGYVWLKKKLHIGNIQSILCCTKHTNLEGNFTECNYVNEYRHKKIFTKLIRYELWLYDKLICKKKKKLSVTLELNNNLNEYYP